MANTLKRLTKILFFLPILAFSWWDGGHMTIAEIAYSELTTSAKANIDALVEEFSKHYPEYDSLAAMAVWPDDVRAKGRLPCFGGSHGAFQIYDPDQVLTEKDKRWITQCFSYQSAENGIWIARHTLENADAPTIERGLMLALFVHLVGDLHQPLHTTSRYSAKHPFGDFGGNDFLLKNCQWLTLHALWDAAAGAFPMQRYIDSPYSAHGVAEKLKTRYPVHLFDEVFNFSPTAWAREGQEIVSKDVYLLEENSCPSDEYLHHVQAIAQKRVILAGYRLGYLLNEIFE